ncbi:MAG TPA: chaperone NapD [Alphaproteobacteria bacterium]|nr:chaperone NapD [Alphaproteobacteria bacterium]
MSREHHISSLVVHGRPERLAAIGEAIRALEGAEVHAMEAGRMVVTLETASESAILLRIHEIGLIDGVMSATLAFHHVERLSEEDEP